MIIYLAGPMSGIANFNYPAFEAAATEMREMGLTVLSPHEIDNDFPDRAHYSDPDQEWLFYMQQCIPMVFKAHAICMLPDWDRSKGAIIEYVIATERKIPLYFYGTERFRQMMLMLQAVTADVKTPQ